MVGFSAVAMAIVADLAVVDGVVVGVFSAVAIGAELVAVVDGVVVGVVVFSAVAIGAELVAVADGVVVGVDVAVLGDSHSNPSPKKP